MDLSFFSSFIACLSFCDSIFVDLLLSSHMATVYHTWVCVTSIRAVCIIGSKDSRKLIVLASSRLKLLSLQIKDTSCMVNCLDELRGFLNYRSREKRLREKKSTLLAHDNHQLENNTVHNFSSRQLTIHEICFFRKDSGFNHEDFLGSLDPILHTARIEVSEKPKVRQTVAMLLANKRSTNMLTQMKELKREAGIRQGL